MGDKGGKKDKSKIQKQKKSKQAQKTKEKLDKQPKKLRNWKNICVNQSPPSIWQPRILVRPMLGWKFIVYLTCAVCSMMVVPILNLIWIESYNLIAEKLELSRF